MQPSPILPPPASASQTPSKGIEQLSKSGCGENASYKFFFVLGLGENNVSEELMPELAHRQRVKLPTCMHSTEYRVHSASPHRYRGQFSRFWGKCSWRPTEQTIHLLHFHLYVQGPSCHGFPCGMFANEFPSFSYLFFCRSDDNTSPVYRPSQSVS